MAAYMGYSLYCPYVLVGCMYVNNNFRNPQNFAVGIGVSEQFKVFVKITPKLFFAIIFSLYIVAQKVASINYSALGSSRVQN